MNEQVRHGLVARAVAKRRSDLQHRIADEASERSAARLARERELAQALQGLQQLARERSS